MEPSKFSDKFQSSGIKQMVKFMDKKEEIAKLPLDKKRSLYKCGDKFCTLKDVKKWSDEGQPIPPDQKYESLLQGSIYKANPTLNNKIGIFFGNIAALEVDAIVNAANRTLMGGGGVDAVIHSAAGPYLLDECRYLSGCETGQAKITGGYNLPAKYVIHTVGPMGENPMLLESCYRNSLKIAIENKCKTIAFPCVSTGVYGYPNQNASQVVLQTVRTFLEANLDDLEMVIFCLFRDVDKNAYSKFLPHYFPI